MEQRDRSEAVGAAVGVGLAALAWLGLTLRDAAVGPAAAVGWEEAWNARGALMVACGHLDALAALQYRPFCGGCSAEALVGAPLLRALGPGRLAWRLVPVLFAAAGGLAGWLALGGRGATLPRGAWLLLALAAPGWIRAQQVTGWGNHAEGTALALLGLAVVARGLPDRGGVVAAGAALVGLSVSFAWSSAWALAALVGMVALSRSPRGAMGLWAAPVGLLPLAARLRGRPEELADAAAFALQLQPAPPGEALRWLWTDFVQGGLWATAGSGGVDAGSALWWAGLGALGVAGAVGARRAPVGRLVGLGLLAALCAWLLRFDLWDDNPRVYGFDWFNLRYRFALWPLLALGAALAARRPVGLAAAVLLAAFSLGHRLAEPADPPPAGPFPSADHSPDPTVPSGAPVQRLAERRHRSQDVEAAAAFVAGHDDPLPLCRDHHVTELGRRVGRGGRPGDDARARGALRSERDAARYAEGVAAGAAARPGVQ